MAEITTVTSNFTKQLAIPGVIGVRLTTTSTSETWVCPYFAEIIAVVANNESDNDGVAISWSGKTITIVAGSGDVITLLVAGRG